MKNKLSIIIVNYNGKDLLAEGLPTILEAAIFSNVIYEIIVVDNASRDDSSAFLKNKYPDVILLPRKINDYWFSVNEGIKKSSYEHLLLLNNDIKLERCCIEYLLAHFDKDDETTFAVVPKEMSWDGALPLKGAQGIEIKNGSFSPSIESIYPDNPIITFNAGNAMYARDKLLKLDLFDPVFYPFCYEDVDVSYRAWKAGFKIIYEPKAIIYHKSRATINKYVTQDDQAKYIFKNSFLFVWKNITDIRLFSMHIFFLIAKLINGLLFFRRKKSTLFGFVLAMQSLKQVRISRKIAAKNFILTDREILHKLDMSKFYEKY